MAQTGKLVFLLGVVLLVVACNTAWAIPTEWEDDLNESEPKFTLRELAQILSQKRLIQQF